MHPDVKTFLAECHTMFSGRFICLKHEFRYDCSEFYQIWSLYIQGLPDNVSHSELCCGHSPDFPTFYELRDWYTKHFVIPEDDGTISENKTPENTIEP